MNQRIVTKVTLLLFIGVLIINYLTATGKIIGLSSQREISGLYPTPITPAGFAFSIWGVIYGLLFIAILYMMRLATTDSPQSLILNQLTSPLWALFAFNIAWNIVFGLGFIGASTVMILGYWLSLIAIGFELLRANEKINFILPLAFGLHTGWITIAGIVNFWAYLIKINWDGLGLHQDLWVIFALFLVLLLVALLQIKLKNSSLPFATAWAFWGIYAKEGSVFLAYPFIPVIILLGIGFLFLLALVTFIKNGKGLLPY